MVIAIHDSEDERPNISRRSSSTTRNFTETRNPRTKHRSLNGKFWTRQENVRDPEVRREISRVINEKDKNKKELIC